MSSGRGLCDELVTRPEESYRLWRVVCDLETSRIGALYIYIYDISSLRVNTAFKTTVQKYVRIKIPNILAVLALVGGCECWTVKGKHET